MVLAGLLGGLAAEAAVGFHCDAPPALPCWGKLAEAS